MDIRELSAEEHQAIKTVFAIAKPETKSGSSIITLKDGSRIFYSADGAYIAPKGLSVEQKDQRIHEFAIGLKGEAEHQRAHAAPGDHRRRGTKGQLSKPKCWQATISKASIISSTTPFPLRIRH